MPLEVRFFAPTRASGTTSTPELVMVITGSCTGVTIPVRWAKPGLVKCQMKRVASASTRADVGVHVHIRRGSCSLRACYREMERGDGEGRWSREMARGDGAG